MHKNKHKISKQEKLTYIYIKKEFVASIMFTYLFPETGVLSKRALFTYAGVLYRVSLYIDPCSITI